jgi:16S rRNA (cytosine967-C5)-methyltransferase
LVLACVEALHLIINQRKYADKVIESVLKKDKRWGARDRAFIAQTVYDIVRNQRMYLHIAGVKTPLHNTEIWRLISIWIVLNNFELPQWKEFEKTPVRRIRGRYYESSKSFVYKESIPDWMDQVGRTQLGTELWEKEVHALNQPAEVVLRVNTLKCTEKELISDLEKDGVLTERISAYPGALIVKERSNLFKTNAFTKGYFEIQDANSQLVAPFLEVQKGHRVIDCCAGAGGKSLHLAALMQNKGQLIAMDIFPYKLNELKKRAKRAGAFNIETRLIEGKKSIKKLKQSAERVLIDAPCSGLGVLKRNPDAKWKLQPEHLDKLKETQQQLLQDYSVMLKPGGKLVYATCSILPQENEKQVETFLKSPAGQSFKCTNQKTLYAHKNGYDGFFYGAV